MSELASIYRHRGLDETLAHKVALQFMQHGALSAHARDELASPATTDALLTNKQ